LKVIGDAKGCDVNPRRDGRKPASGSGSPAGGALAVVLTTEDREVERRAWAFHLGAQPPKVTHLIAEQLPK